MLLAWQVIGASSYLPRQRKQRRLQLHRRDVLRLVGKPPECPQGQHLLEGEREGHSHQVIVEREQGEMKLLPGGLGQLGLLASLQSRAHIWWGQLVAFLGLVV